MSNKLKSKNKKKKADKGYNSWGAVLLFTFLEFFSSYSTDGTEYGGSSDSLVTEPQTILESVGKRNYISFGL